MTKLLNLDELSPEKSIFKLTLNGKTHAMKAASVGGFIRLNSAFSALGEEAETAPVQEQVRAALDILVSAFPTCPAEDFESLSFDSLSATVNYVMESKWGSQEAQDEAEGEAEGEGNAQAVA